MMSETYPDQYQKFLEWIQSRKYDIPSIHSQWGVKVREFRFFDLVFPREWKNRLMKDLNRFVKNDRRVRKIKKNWATRYAMKKANIEPVYANEAIKDIGKSTTREAGNPQFWTYLYYMGLLRDSKAKDHRELPDGAELI